MNNNQTQNTAVPTDEALTRLREALEQYQKHEIRSVEHSIQTARDNVPFLFRILLFGIFGGRREGAHE